MVTTQTVDEFQVNLGRHIRRLRLARKLSVESVAQATNLAEKSVRNLESGCGSTTETLFKVLAAVQAKRVLTVLTPLDVRNAFDAGTELRQRAPRRPRVKTQ